jgi:hypothetical protein
MRILCFSAGKSDIHLSGLPSSFKASPAAYLLYPEIQTIMGRSILNTLHFKKSSPKLVHRFKSYSILNRTIFPLRV